MTEHVGGYRFDLEDHAQLEVLTMQPRHLELLMAEPVARPREMSSRSKVAVKNQQSEGACNGFATRAALRLCAAFGGSDIDFSGDGMYYAIQQRDRISGDRGSTVAGGLWVASNIGGIPDSAMPETPRYDPQRLPVNYKDLASPYKVRNAAILKTYREIVEWLGKGYGGVWYGCLWGFSFSGGQATGWRASGGGHATAIDGYGGQEDSDGLPAWLDCLNSWGTNFGDRGRYRVSRSIMERVLRDGYTVVAGISDMENVKPRRINWLEREMIG